ncbi:FUSC family protein [Acinetobacter guerrae]|uniref:FUSC family protein n=1 Tax=Acinetobacter guerrae TaxID=1843371 RepID=UPI00128B8432|nr:FUSC family protein [Acinetobacter guerrae]MPW45669.1 fusaric acid resistance protein [Acinetobacter guerrae]
MLFKQILAFRPSRMDLIFAVKTFIAMMLALYTAFVLDLTYPMWAAGTVIIIAQPYAGMVSSKALYRLTGTVLGGILAIFFTPRLIDMPILFTCILAIWVGFCLYISLLDRTPRSYVFMLAGYTTVMIACSSIYNIDSHSVFDMALSRVLEISIAVICSAVVSATIFPAHLGAQLQQRVQKTLDDTRDVFTSIMTDQKHSQSYTQLLGSIARDTTDIHGLAVHLAYESGELHGMTKPIQELLHQETMVVANLVSMSERIYQLDQIDLEYRRSLVVLYEHVLQFLRGQTDIEDDQLNQLPPEFEQDFEQLFSLSTPAQIVMMDALKMDTRHFIQNVMAVKLLWQLIQRGEKRIPTTIAAITTQYPSLHRDHGIAVRSSVAAALATATSFLIWIYTGWHAGYMMAQLTAVSACILSMLDDPIPALKTFIRGSIYAAILTIFYAFTIMPQVHEFWQLALVLAPLVIYLASMFPTPMLMMLALPMLINFIMSLNLQNRYAMDAVILMDTAMAGVIGPIISILAIYFIRSMSPETSARRILSLHYRALREALYIPYGVNFRIHLRSMLDRIGILNSKLVQSAELKHAMNLALIETSAVINLSRIAELSQNNKTLPELKQALRHLQQLLEASFRDQEKNIVLDSVLKAKVLAQIDYIETLVLNEPDIEVRHRIQMGMNNIRSSIFHVQKNDSDKQVLNGAVHG